MTSGLVSQNRRWRHFYDFPQKKRGKMMAMYLVGMMMNHPKLRKRMGSKITEGMIMPYKKVIEKK